MRVVTESSEDEMVAVFLSGELRSDRFGPGIRQALSNAGADLRVVTSPDLADETENALRAQVLEETRALTSVARACSAGSRRRPLAADRTHA